MINDLYEFDMENYCGLTRSIADTPPPGPRHEGMVEDVQEGDLAMLLPQHKEDLYQGENSSYQTARKIE